MLLGMVECGVGRRRAGTSEVVLSWVVVCAQPGPAALVVGKFRASGALAHPPRRGRCAWAGPMAWRAAGPGAQSSALHPFLGVGRGYGASVPALPCSVCHSQEPPLPSPLALHGADWYVVQW